MEPLQPAPFTRRLLSWCYEALLISAVLFAAGLLYLFVENRAGLPHLRIAFQLYLFFAAGAYFVWHWTHGGQTLAMKTWHIRLVTHTGSPIDVNRAIARYVLAILGLAACGISLLWALFDRDGQFLHDRLSGTRLVLA